MESETIAQQKKHNMTKKTRCWKCRGTGTILGLGCIPKICDNCKGTRWISERWADASETAEVTEVSPKRSRSKKQKNEKEGDNGSV